MRSGRNALRSYVRVESLGGCAGSLQCLFQLSVGHTGCSLVTAAKELATTAVKKMHMDRKTGKSVEYAHENTGNGATTGDVLHVILNGITVGVAAQGAGWSADKIYDGPFSLTSQSPSRRSRQ
jgi:hypothetical protein